MVSLCGLAKWAVVYMGTHKDVTVLKNVKIEKNQIKQMVKFSLQEGLPESSAPNIHLTF